ncbi:MAG: cytochrome c1 [Pseudohongiellaceae bacterium]|nr:cytochrome c1 [Pseudohongiellaceae bacterium]
MTWKQLVISIALLAALVILPLKAVGAESNVELDHVEVDVTDKDSLQSGFKYYMNYCVACHSLKYARYERTANDLGIPTELVMDNIIFNDHQIGDLMDNSISPDDAKNWFGAPPPDLTLIGRVRSPDWLYTYLRTFYEDDSRPWGVNNVAFPNVGMPNVLHELQGDVVCAHGDMEHCELEHVEGTGSMTPDEFDAAVADLVNFLYYIGEPIREKREYIGFFVLGFIAILFVFVSLLNREYWKKIH